MSKKLKAFEKKLKYLKKDWVELGKSFIELMKQAWNLGIDIAKALAQTISLWEALPNIPEVAQTGKMVGKFLKRLKFR